MKTKKTVHQRLGWIRLLSSLSLCLFDDATIFFLASQTFYISNRRRMMVASFGEFLVNFSIFHRLICQLPRNSGIKSVTYTNKHDIRYSNNNECRRRIVGDRYGDRVLGVADGAAIVFTIYCHQIFSEHSPQITYSICYNVDRHIFLRPKRQANIPSEILIRNWTNRNGRILCCRHRHVWLSQSLIKW